MEKEVVDYCVSDVEILAQSCLQFRQLMMQEGEVCPFTEASTLPAACNKIFRRKFLKHNTIGLIPRNGYRWADVQSEIAVKWLIWEEKCRDININHAAKYKEAVVEGVKVDGFCHDNKQVFEFHGCYYHGCPNCFKYRRLEPSYDNPNETPESRYKATLVKTERLRRLGYEVIEMWECEFRRRMLNKDIKEFTENHPLLVNLPLNPREAFTGSRTEVEKLYYKVGKNEKIKYVDVCSLYPYINKYGLYPVGHPDIYVGDSECQKLDLNSIEGLIKCTILPPQDLYLPVLPYKLHNRLLFPLCRTCAEALNEGECNHEGNERALTGTWTLCEIKKAIEKGYVITKMYEVWVYKTVQYNKETKSGGPFYRVYK